MKSFRAILIAAVCSIAFLSVTTASAAGVHTAKHGVHKKKGKSKHKKHHKQK